MNNQLKITVRNVVREIYEGISDTNRQLKESNCGASYKMPSEIVFNYDDITFVIERVGDGWVHPKYTPKETTGEVTEQLKDQ